MNLTLALILLSSLAFGQSSTDTAKTDELRIVNISKDIRQLQSGRPTITGVPTYMNGMTVSGAATFSGNNTFTGTNSFSGEVTLSSTTSITGPATFTQTPSMPWGTIKWVVFVGTQTTSPTIMNSVGVTSITYVNTGNYRVNFTTPWTSADSYACTCSATASGASTDEFCTIGIPSTSPPHMYTTSMEVSARSGGSGVENPFRVHIICFGE